MWRRINFLQFLNLLQEDLFLLTFLGRIVRKMKHKCFSAKNFVIMHKNGCAIFCNMPKLQKIEDSVQKPCVFNLNIV